MEDIFIFIKSTRILFFFFSFFQKEKDTETFDEFNFFTLNIIKISIYCLLELFNHDWTRLNNFFLKTQKSSRNIGCKDTFNGK